MGFVEIASQDQIPPGTMKSFSVAGKAVLVVNIAGKFYAVADKCPHFAGDLSKGRLEGSTVICPRHGSQFDVSTGKRLKGPAARDLPVYPIQLDGAKITADVQA